MSDDTKRMILQFPRIQEIKEIIAENNSLCIRVAWFENANLFQARQEKKLLSQYPSLS